MYLKFISALKGHVLRSYKVINFILNYFVYIVIDVNWFLMHPTTTEMDNTQKFYILNTFYNSDYTIYIDKYKHNQFSSGYQRGNQVETLMLFFPVKWLFPDKCFHKSFDKRFYFSLYCGLMYVVYCKHCKNIVFF